jgi:hypothetical protein
LLTKMSQESNTKLRVIAENLVAEVAPQGKSCGDPADRDPGSDDADRDNGLLRAAHDGGG